MDQRHREYIEYYRSRMKKYENNPMYTHSYQSEKTMFDAISGIEKLEDFREIMETPKLHIKNAIALTKDKNIAENKLYIEIKEYVRAKASEKVLAVIDSMKSDTELVNTVNTIEAECARQTSIDLMAGMFYSDFTVMENIECWGNAVVPDEWKQEINRDWVAEDVKRTREVWINTVLPEARKFAADWDMNYDLLWEDRHRRLIPVPDDIIRKRTDQHKKIRGV
jgi:hypothetical protein